MRPRPERRSEETLLSGIAGGGAARVGLAVERRADAAGELRAPLHELGGLLRLDLLGPQAGGGSLPLPDGGVELVAARLRGVAVRHALPLRSRWTAPRMP